MELDTGSSALEEVFDLKFFLCAAIWERLVPSALQITKKHMCIAKLWACWLVFRAKGTLWPVS